MVEGLGVGGGGGGGRTGGGWGDGGRPGGRSWGSPWIQQSSCVRAEVLGGDETEPGQELEMARGGVQPCFLFC